MPGIADWSPRTSFWVWSTFGPALNGIEDDLFFKNGIHSHPLPGPVAERYQLMGYMSTLFDPGMEFSHWEGSGYRRSAHFNKPVREINDGFPPTPEGYPERLPDEWVALFLRYTWFA